MTKAIKGYKNMEKMNTYRNRQRKINYQKGGFVGQGRRKWEKEDVDTLLNRSFLKDRELAQILKRSVSAIQKKRWKLNII